MLETRQEKIAKDDLKYCMKRVKFASWMAALLFPLFGLSSYSTLKLFIPELTLFESVWPRVLAGSIPFLLLFALMHQERIKASTRLGIWCISFSLINCAAACLHVWPAALTDPKILLYFSSNNNLVLVASSIFLALPMRATLLFFGSYAIFFIFPLLYLSFPDSHVFRTVANDIFVATMVSGLVKVLARGAHRESIADKHEQLEKTNRFIDKDLAAILEKGEDENSLSGRRDVFILQMDIRRYTEFLKKHESNDELLLAFSKELNTLVRRTLTLSGGKTHKTLGDGYLCLFSVDDQDDMKKRQRQLARVVHAYFRIHNEFLAILHKHGLEDMNMRLCGAIHFGSVLFDFFGSEDSLEFDVVSRHLSLAGRLEQHSKRLEAEFGEQSFLVLSREAYAYFEQKRVAYSPVRQMLTGENGNQIRSFPDVSEIYYIASDSGYASEDMESDSNQSVA